MIFANIKDCKKYGCIHKEFSKAFEFLNNNGLDSLSLGRHEIDGENVFALVQEYETKPVDGAMYEAHKKFIDIQYIVSGKENMGYSSIYNLEASTSYDSEKDFMMLDGDRELFLANKGEFFIFFPEDAHMPGIIAGDKSKVRKIVIKVRI